MPKNSKIQVSAQGRILIHLELSTSVLVYPNLSNKSLLSIGKPCNEECIEMFDNKVLIILENGKSRIIRHTKLIGRSIGRNVQKKGINSIKYIISRNRDKKN